MSASIETLLEQMLAQASYAPNGAMLSEGNNVAAIVPLAADTNGDRHWHVDTVCVSYSAAPTNGLFTVYAGATPIFRVDVIAGGPTTFAVFKDSEPGAALMLVLSPGGSGITGRLNVNAELT